LELAITQTLIDTFQVAPLQVIMGPLSYLIAFACIALAAHYWLYKRTSSSSGSSSSSTTRKTTKSKNFLDFDKDCALRSLKPSDLSSVKALVNGKGGCGYFKDHALTPYLDESDTKHMAFGVEHKSSGQIICTQFILMVDDNETGIVLGAMFDPKYQSSIRICYTQLSNHIQEKLSDDFEDLGKHRTLSIEGGVGADDYCNCSGLAWRIKFNLDSMTDDNVYYLYNARTSDGDGDGQDGVKVNGDFQDSEDVDLAMNLLTATFGLENVVIDWRMFQTKCLKEVLVEEVKAKKMGIAVNRQETALVLMYGGSDYYVFGKEPADVLSAIRFSLSQSSDPDVGVFVSKAMVGDNEEIRKMFGKAMDREICGLDYDMHIDGH